MSHIVRHLAPGMVVAAAVVLLAACGGGGDAAPPGASPGTPSTPSTPPSSPAPADSALRAAQPGELVAYFRARIAQRSAQGMEGTQAATLMPVPVAPPVTTTAGSSAPTDSRVSSTTLQEAGVDEDDLLKIDGGFVYALQPAYHDTAGLLPARLAVHRIQPDGALAAAGHATLGTEFGARGLYVAAAARRITVIGERQGYGDIQPATAAASLLPMPVTPQVGLDVLALNERGEVAPAQRVVIDGRLVASRMIGNVLYVASTWTPDLSIYRVPPRTPTAQVEATLANLGTAALLPTVRVGSAAAQPLVAESDCLLQPANASLSLQLTTITAIDLASTALQRRSTCFVGDATALYMSPASVYLASSRHYWLASTSALAILPRQGSTDIHKFALAGLQVDYRGSGEVAGHLGWDVEKMPYRMSEHNGDLRVLTFTGETGWAGEPVIQVRTPMPTVPGTATATSTTTATSLPTTPASPATLTVLREDTAARRLAVVATLPNAQRPAALGRPGEQVYGVRFAGPLAYVVTFRRTDPLYVLDLSNPADPRAAGELAVPGFSDYLFPLANGRLLGVGKDATADGLVQGLKVALFDVSNTAQPRVLASIDLGERGSASALDFTRHGINLLEQGANVRVALPVRLASNVASRSVRYQQGLARFDVDTAAGTLGQRPLFAGASFDTTAPWTQYARFDLGKDRAVQTTQATYYLSGGEVRHLPER